MTQWKFYLSGILYGACEVRAGAIFHCPLNVATAQLEPEKELTPQDSWYLELGHMDVRQALLNMDAYQKGICSGETCFTTEDGERFERRDTGSWVQRNIKFPKDLIVEGERIIAILTPFRDQCAVLVQDGFEEKTILRQWMQKYPRPIQRMLPMQTVAIPMRDGVKLAADVYLPDVQQPVSTMLVRTPYGKAMGAVSFYKWVQRGYAVVVQDVRGREDSEGEWMPMYYETEDGDDTLNWIAAQSWSDGSVAMCGASYLGYVQWAAAASGNPHLKALLSSQCAGSPFGDVPRKGGCFNSGTLAWAFAVSGQRANPMLMMRDDWDEVMKIRPLRDLAPKALGYPIPFLEKWLDHVDYDEFWEKGDWKRRTKECKVPAVIMSGWFDDNGSGTTEALELYREFPDKKVILGPWVHSGNAAYDLNGWALGSNALRYDMDLVCLDWLEHYLHGVENGIEKTPKVEYYTMGSNCWKTAVNWPLPDTKRLELYLDGVSENAAVQGKGLLAVQQPVQTGADAWTYDPMHPAVHIIDMSENEGAVPADYAQQEQRPDVLCYTTRPLEKELTVTGEVTAELYLSSDCVDTDLVIRITDVDLAGRSMKLADGMLSARYRDGYEKPKLMEPGTVYPLVIGTSKLSHTFLPGHCLRLTVTSGAENMIFPNRNSGNGCDGVECCIAHNKLHRGSGTLSKIILPTENNA